MLSDSAMRPSLLAAVDRDGIGKVRGRNRLTPSTKPVYWSPYHMPIDPVDGKLIPGPNNSYLRTAPADWRALAQARVTLVHDWLTGYRGGEKCLAVLCRQFPSAPLFTLLHVPGTLPPAIERMSIHPSFLQRIPRIDRYYRYTLP